MPRGVAWQCWQVSVQRQGPVSLWGHQWHSGMSSPWATHTAQQGGSLKAGSGNPGRKSAAAGTRLCLNCIGSFITINKMFISFISLIYFPCFKPLIYVRTLEEIIAVHLKRAFPLAIPWQSSNTQDIILKTQHKEPACLWVSPLKFANRENFFWKILAFEHKQFRTF